MFKSHLPATFARPIGWRLAGWVHRELELPNVNFLTLYLSTGTN